MRVFGKIPVTFARNRDFTEVRVSTHLLVFYTIIKHLFRHA